MPVHECVSIDFFVSHGYIVCVCTLYATVHTQSSLETVRQTNQRNQQPSGF